MFSDNLILVLSLIHFVDTKWQIDRHMSRWLSKVFIIWLSSKFKSPTIVYTVHMQCCVFIWFYWNSRTTLRTVLFSCPILCESPAISQIQMSCTSAGRQQISSFLLSHAITGEFSGDPTITSLVMLQRSVSLYTQKVLDIFISFSFSCAEACLFLGGGGG